MTNKRAHTRTHTPSLSLTQGWAPEQRGKEWEKMTPEQRARLKVLNDDPKLRESHQQLVGGGTLTDDEFWEINKV